MILSTWSFYYVVTSTCTTSPIYIGLHSSNVIRQRSILSHSAVLLNLSFISAIWYPSADTSLHFLSSSLEFLPIIMGSPNSLHVDPSNGRSAIDDPLSPYFLHHLDSPSILVSQPLTDDNYSSWSRSMSIALSVKNKLGFINGSITKPNGNDLHLP